jgi:hypothetical protein
MLFGHNSDMEFDQRQIQLLFNVISITAITSLSLFCAILKRDKDRLISEINLGRSENRDEPSVTVLNVGPTREPHRPAAPDMLKTMQLDIRQFVARRSNRWIAQSQSSGFAENS